MFKFLNHKVIKALLQQSWLGISLIIFSILFILAVNSCGLPDGLEESECGKKSNTACDGPYLKHYDPEALPIRMIHGVNRWHITINPANNEQLLFIKKTPSTNYDLVIYDRSNSSEKVIYSANSLYNFKVSNFGVIAIPDFNILISINGNVINRFDERKFRLYFVRSFSPTDSTVFYAYFSEDLLIDRKGLYDFEKDSLIRELDWSGKIHWKSAKECFVYTSDKLLLYDVTESYDNPKEVIYDFNNLNDQIYFSNIPTYADVFDGNLISLNFGVNLININNSTITKINNVDCHKVEIEHAVWDKLNNKILFIKNVVIANEEHEYVSENFDLFEMDMDGCNEKKFFND